MKAVLIGGYPKGFEYPFSIKTVSGRRLYNLARGVGLDFTVCDLWETAEQEREGLVSDKKRAVLHDYLKRGYLLVALGNHVRDAMYLTLFPFITLPHPASRRPVDLAELERGLRVVEALRW